MRLFIHVLLMALMCVSLSLLVSAQESATDEAPTIVIPPGPVVPLEENRVESDLPAQSASVMLRELSAEKRANAELSLLLEPHAGAEAVRTADEMCRLWNEGDDEAALELFDKLETLTDPREISAGVAWRTPLLAAQDKAWGTDRRIGDRDSIYAVDLDVDPQTQNLFATCVYRRGTTGSGWSMNISHDQGYTWNETYSWSATYHINDLTATIVGDHCYVFFTRGSNQDQVLGYCFRRSDGAPDTFPGGPTYVTAFTTTSPEAVEEVSVVSNIDFEVPGHYRLYLAAITSLGNVEFYWSTEYADSWTPSISGLPNNAQRGLDLSMNVGFDTYWGWMSYLDNAATPVVHVYGFNGLTWTDMFTSPVNSANCWYTSIGAYKDTVHCMYDYYSGSRYYVKYHVSYNGGTSFLWGTVNDTTVTSYAPAICARRGGGVGATYRYYGPVEFQFTWRDYGGWPWDLPPQGYTDHYPDYKPAAIDYVGGDVYGIAYISTVAYATAWYDFGPGCCNLPGDANNDQATNVGDAVFLINYAFKGGPPPTCLDAGDANVDCMVNVGDVVYLINYAFKAGPTPGCGCTGP